MIHTETPIEFKDEKNFFAESTVFNHLQSYLSEDFKEFDSTEKIYVSLTLKACLENIIKHDLTLESTINIDHKWLITDNNSEMVRDFFYKTFFCDEETYNTYTVEINNARDTVEATIFSINNWILEIHPDSIEILKKEAEEFFKIKPNKPSIKIK